MSGDSRRYARNPDMIARRIRGEHLLVPIARHSAALDSLYALNATAGLVWERAGEGHAAGDIARELAQAYAIPNEQAQADVARAIEELVGIGALLERTEPS